MADNSIGEDLRLLRMKLRGDAPKSAAKARRQRDSRHMLKENDGRRRRGVGVDRPEQINFKCREGTKARFTAVAEAMNTSMIAVLERALELVEKEARVA